MKTLFLQKIIQHSIECYIGKTDPRHLVKVATKIEMSATQDAQRPLSEKRVKDIAKYVSEEQGILPNTLTLATKDDRLDVILIDEEKGKLNEDGTLNFNANSLTVLKDAKLEAGLASLKKGESVQLIRNGYFCADSKDSTEDHLVLNRIVGLKSSYKPASN